MTNVRQKTALLLHTAGMTVQDIFYTLEVVAGAEGDNNYTIAKKALRKYITSQSNVPNEAQFSFNAQRTE